MLIQTSLVCSVCAAFTNSKLGRGGPVQGEKGGRSVKEGDKDRKDGGRRGRRMGEGEREENNKGMGWDGRRGEEMDGREEVGGEGGGEEKERDERRGEGWRGDRDGRRRDGWEERGGKRRGRRGGEGGGRRGRGWERRRREADREREARRPSHFGREVNASKPALEATSLRRAWNCASSSSLGSTVWSPSFNNRACNAPLISRSLFSANRP